MRSLSALLGIGLSTLVSSCVIAIGSDSCGPTLSGSGVRATEVRSVGSFCRIRVAGSTEVVARVGEEPEVRVCGDDNLLHFVRVRVEGDTLVVDMEPGSFSTRSGLEVQVTTPRLEGVTIQGSADADVSGLRGESFSAVITGSGSLKASGDVDRLTASVAGSGEMELASLHAKRASVQIAGSGDIEVCASDDLSIQISGSGEVSYHGDPTLHQTIAGSGDVRRVR